MSLLLIQSNENDKYSLSPTNMYKYDINNVNVDNCTNGRTILFFVAVVMLLLIFLVCRPY